MSASDKTATTEKAIREGELPRRSKRKKITTTWKKVRVSLTSRLLRFSRQGKVSGVIDLRTVTAVVAKSPEKHGKMATFEVLTAAGGWILAAQTEEEAAAWSSDISRCVGALPPANAKLLETFRRADKDKSGTIEFDEVQRLLKELGARVAAKAVKEKFLQVDKDGTGSLDFTEFERFYHNLMAHDALAPVFERYSHGSPFIDRHGLAEFYRECQGKEISRAETQRVLDLHRNEALDVPFGCIDARGFADWLCSPAENGVVDEDALAVPQDMTRPLPSYWIASSHNTYLEADQLKGAASVEAYRRALARGCRCVEIDTWDGPKGSPIVTHGHTLTSKIALTDVLDTVRKNAFVPPADLQIPGHGNFPVILSIENHCSPPQQEVMANLFRDMLGPMLAAPPGTAQVLPSPAVLVGKILVKGKTLTPMMPVIAEPAPPPPASEEQKAKEKKKKKEPEPSVTKSLSDVTFLGTFSIPSGPIGATTSLAGGRPACVMFSVSETKLSKIVKGVNPAQPSPPASPTQERKVSAPAPQRPKHPVKPEALSAVQKYNATHLSRVYPKGIRITSSNYDPALGWTCGCQLVALNYQTSSLPMWVNEAKFSMNLGCGYVLKPEWMLRGTEPPEAPVRRLRVKVISAGQLPSTERDIIDPFVALTLVGYHTDSAEHRTKTISDNGWNPRWDEEFEFSMRAPEAAVLNVAVWDRDVTTNACVGRCTFPVTAIRKGYRALALYDPKTSTIVPESHILCQFSLS